VIAHEFGHFRQGAAMRLSYVIRRVNPEATGGSAPTTTEPNARSAASRTAGERSA